MNFSLLCVYLSSNLYQLNTFCYQEDHNIALFCLDELFNKHLKQKKSSDDILMALTILTNRFSCVEINLFILTFLASP